MTVAPPVPLGRMGCLGCDGTYAVGFLRCPHCKTRSPLFPPVDGEESEVPKVTSGGTSHAGEVVADAPAVPVDVDGAEVVGFAWSAEDELADPDGDGPQEDVPAPDGPKDASEVPDGAGADGEAATADGPADGGAPVEESLSAADVAAGYTDLSFAELRAEAKSRGLPAGGSAVELAARLGEHDEAQAASAPDPAVEGGAS